MFNNQVIQIKKQKFKIKDQIFDIIVTNFITKNEKVLSLKAKTKIFFHAKNKILLRKLSVEEDWMLVAAFKIKNIELKIIKINETYFIDSENLLTIFVKNSNVTLLHSLAQI